MWSRMTSMKKYIPVLATLSLGIVVLGSQVLFKGRNINASPSKEVNRVKLHYENNLKGIEFFENDKKFSLSATKAPVVIINFWASWCVPCLEEFPSLVNLRKKYSRDKVIILGINTDDKSSIKDANKVIQKYGINFPTIFDTDSKLIEKFKVSSIPISIIYKNGKVQEVSKGAKDFFSGEFLEEIESFIK